jgi:ketosteroid isomerase-like protein
VSANLDLVRSIYAAFELGDFSRADWADPQIEYVVMDGPSPGTFTGLTGIATGVREILSPWKDLHDVIDEYRELDDERVLVLLRHDLRGKTSGLGLDASWTRGAEIVHIKQGRVTRIVKYFDRDRALADLGLIPEGEKP